MLGLQLRNEFMESRLKGTAIVFSDDKRYGSLNIEPREFLEISYPTHDSLKCLREIGPNGDRPVVIIGERGLGKSHLMTMLYHATHSTETMRSWLNGWADKLSRPEISDIELRKDMHVIGVSLHRQDYNFLWDILFENHPRGEHYRGKWEGMGEGKTGVPPSKLIIEMLQEQPTVLLLDECQTWYNSLTNSKQYPWKNWAFNFIQILSEIASDYPNLLVLVVSVRSGDNELHQQIHRNNPVVIDFKAGGSPEQIQRDRRRMLLHRLFENRLNILGTEINELLEVHINEYFRLKKVPTAEQDRLRSEFIDSWPFAPHLLRFLEDQVLIAVAAQDTRDLIRILANLYKSQGKDNAILTAADFRLDDEKSGIGALLDSIANEHHRTLREKAQRNLISVEDTHLNSMNKLEHLDGIMASLWLHSISLEKDVGASSETLQVDITKDVEIDDNAFREELNSIVESSFNIHEFESRLMFKEEENPQAKVLAHAKNDRLFTDGLDYVELSTEIHNAITNNGEISTHNVIVLQKNWLNLPWSELSEDKHPDNWDDRLPLIIIPEFPVDLNATLGEWIKQHVPSNRNTIRFLLPKNELENGIFNRNLLIQARAIFKSREFSKDFPIYLKFVEKFRKELQSEISELFNKFAILDVWEFGDSSKCKFNSESFREDIGKILGMIETKISNDLFVPEDFEAIVLNSAENHISIRAVLDELKEPPPSTNSCIPWLGEIHMKERILRLCAKGKIEISVQNRYTLRAEPGKSEDEVWNELKSRLTLTGRGLSEAILRESNPVPVSSGQKLDNKVTQGQFESNLVNEEGLINPADESESLPNIAIEDETHKVWKYFETIETSGLNLYGSIESWKIKPTTPIEEVNLKICARNGSELVDVLKQLPDGIRFVLSLKKDESNDD